MIKVCKQCGNKIKSPRKTSKFCSYTCFNLNRNVKTKIKNEKNKKECEICKQIFISSYSEQRFCSNKCVGLNAQNVNAKARILKKCEVCNKEFHVHNKSTQRYCSSKCRTNASRKPNKICPICNKEFRGKSKHCSRECANKTISLKRKEFWNNANSRTHMQEIMNSKEYKKNMSKSVAAFYIKHPEKRIEAGIRAKKFLSDPKEREKISIRNKQLYIDNPERRDETSKRIKQSYIDNPERREKMSATLKELWSNPAYAEQQFKLRGTYKEYKFPSGKIVKVQGYEPQAITKLLETHLEDDLIVGVKNINKEIGLIKYIQNNKEHTYYPDIYIKSEHKIIEVKSHWTYNLHKEKNLIKKHTCIQQGFNFEFMIMD